MQNVHPIIQWFNTFQRETEQLFKKENKSDCLGEKNQSGSDGSILLLLPTLKHLENTGMNEAFVDAHIIQSVDTEDCYINRLGHCLSFKDGFIYGIWGFSYQIFTTEICLASIVEYQNVCLASGKNLVGILIDRPIPVELKLPRPLASHAENPNAKNELFENDENFYLTEEKVEECIKEWSEIYPIFKRKLYRDLNFFKNKFLLIPGCSYEVASKIKKLTHESLAPVLYSESLKHPIQSTQSFSDVWSSLCNKKPFVEKVLPRQIMAHILHRHFYKNINDVLWMYMERETNQINQALRFYIDSIINQSTNSKDIETKPDDLNTVVRSLVHWLNSRGVSDVTLLSHLLHPSGLVQKLQTLESTSHSLSPFEKQCYFIDLQNEINMTVLKFIKDGKTNYESALPCSLYPSEKLFTPSSLCLLLSLCLTRPYCQIPTHTAHMSMLLYDKEEEDFPNYTALASSVNTLEVFFHHVMNQVYSDD